MTSSDRRLAPRGGPRPDRALERDACGIGFVADVTGRTDRRVVELGLQGLAKLRHRGAFAADEQTGDGAACCSRSLAGSSRTRSAPRSARHRNWACSCCSSATSGRPVRSVRPSRMPAAVSGSASCAGAMFRSILRRWGITPATRGRASCRRCSARLQQTTPRVRNSARIGHGAASTRSRVQRTAMCTSRPAASRPSLQALAGGPLAAFYRPPRPRRQGTVHRVPPAVLPTPPTWERAAIPDAVSQRRDRRSPATRTGCTRVRGRLGLATLAEALFRPPSTMRIKLGHPR